MRDCEQRTRKQSVIYLQHSTFNLTFSYRGIIYAKWRKSTRKTPKFEIPQGAFRNAAGGICQRRRRRLKFHLHELSDFYSRKW